MNDEDIALFKHGKGRITLIPSRTEFDSQRANNDKSLQACCRLTCPPIPPSRSPAFL